MEHDLPEISIIIPILNEAEELPGLLENLAWQSGIRFEAIFCDGGSTDSSPAVLKNQADTLPFSIRLLSAPRGRGRQMNCGAEAARSDLLLFLHADSRFCTHMALFRAVTSLKCRQATSTGTVAGRFSLRFRRQEQHPSLPYAYYESKARLNRSDCIRGDQGFMLNRQDFIHLGKFTTDYPFLEDIHLAEAVAEDGLWLLFQEQLSTSARRFEQEGLYERQVVNAIITNAVANEWQEFFTALPSLYRITSESGKLQLSSLMTGIRDLLSANPVGWRRKFWNGTGKHVSANSWQLFFWLDVRRAFQSNNAPDLVETRWLGFYLRHLQSAFTSPPTVRLATAVTWLWYRWILFTGTSQKA